MGFKDDYKKETRLSLADVAEEIHRTVLMEEVLKYYCPEKINRERRKRIPCPLHNGNDNNFSYSDRAFRCFVCGEGGDTIAFVQKYLGLADRKAAIERMDADLNLNLSFKRVVSAEETDALKKRRAEAEEKARLKQEADDRYNELMDKFVWAEKTKRTAEPFSDEWCKAAKDYDYYAYLIGIEESERYHERN